MVLLSYARFLPTGGGGVLCLRGKNNYWTTVVYPVINMLASGWHTVPGSTYHVRVRMGARALFCCEKGLLRNVMLLLALAPKITLPVCMYEMCKTKTHVLLWLSARRQVRVLQRLADGYPTGRVEAQHARKQVQRWFGRSRILVRQV